MMLNVGGQNNQEPSKNNHPPNNGSKTSATGGGIGVKLVGWLKLLWSGSEGNNSSLSPASKVNGPIKAKPKQHPVKLMVLTAWRKSGAKMMIMNIIISLMTIVAYFATDVSPEVNWRAPFVGYTIPIFLVLQFLFMLIWGFRSKPSHLLLPLATILVGFKHLRATLAINVSPDVVHHDLKVVSYNIRMMQGYGLVRDRTKEEAKAMVTWLQGTDADIICLQEYYNNAKRFGFDFEEQMQEVGFKYRYFSEARRTYWVQGQLGMIIYSKFPIVGHKTLHKSDGPNNQIMYADVKTRKGIIRVYDVHLHSLQLKERELNTKGGGEKIKQNAKSVGSKLRHGFLERTQQVRLLDSNIKSSPYPVIVCGDYNDLPYSYTYTTFRKHLDNAFEEAGSGFDFSFNGKIPFLRIDNQFCSPSFRVLNFETWDQVGLSDHFPIVGWYQMDKLEGQQAPTEDNGSASQMAKTKPRTKRKSDKAS